MDSIGDTHSMKLLVIACHFGRLHIEQSHQKGERGFRSLIFIYTIGMKSIPASARRWIVKRHL